MKFICIAPALLACAFLVHGPIGKDNCGRCNVSDSFTHLSKMDFLSPMGNTRVMITNATEVEIPKTPINAAVDQFNQFYYSVTIGEKELTLFLCIVLSNAALIITSSQNNKAKFFRFVSLLIKLIMES